MRIKYGVILAAMIFCSFGFSPLIQVQAQSIDTLGVALAYHPADREKSSYVFEAYESVLQEEGVPYIAMDVARLLAMPAATVVAAMPAIIFPDAVLQRAPAELSRWTRDYLAQGGNVAVVYDPGTKDRNGAYLNRSVLADVTGVNYITYGNKGADAYGTGSVRLASKAARDFFQIPAGKTSKDNLILTTYGYGELIYPLAAAEMDSSVDESSLYAEGKLRNGEHVPVIMLASRGKGKVLYVNLPLGHLKAYEDDLPLRAIMRTFLFDVVKIPHLMNVPKATGGLVINWHVDSVVEYDTLPVMKKLGYLRKGLRASIHITAGDSFIKLGDQEGFDACGMGKSLTRMLGEYGTVGSHGGWAHNWFADNIRSGMFKEAEIRTYIDKNNKCIESVLGGKIREYSAPVGVHPQPAATKALEALGMIAYYYTGDMGSAPNRTFAAGKKVSDQVIAFPIVPFESSASFYEMYSKAGKSDEEVESWLLDTLSYIARNRVTRLIYSHPRDIGYYQTAITKAFDQAERMQRNNALQVRSMTETAEFLLRSLRTEYVFTHEGKALRITLKNDAGLKDITVAIPKNKYAAPLWAPTYILEDDNYYYVIMREEDGREANLVAPRI